MKYIKLFNTHNDYETYINSQDKILPNVSYCEDNDEVHYNPIDYSKRYLRTIALEDGEISFNIWYSMGTDLITSISYSIDDGRTWTTVLNEDDKEENLLITVNVSKGDKVLWKGTALQTGYYDDNDDEMYGSFFSSDCEFNIDGNVMSLLYWDNFIDETELKYGYQFTNLFYDYNELLSCLVVNAKNLILPATTLTKNCYSGMFSDCTSLITAPKLLATTLADYCYTSMFAYCTSLTTAPELPATTLANSCYMSMFDRCSSLTTPPKLPATILANGCYNSMFYDCRSLTTAPELLATTLVDYCYNSMFDNCTSLVTAPALPATTLADSCYSNMFYGCTSLITAPNLPATTLANSCYSYMFYGCTSLTSAPELPAVTLTQDCYSYMFKDCTSLNYIKAMFTTTPSTTYTNSWVLNVSVTGTFVRSSASSLTVVVGIHGVPLDWTVEVASE